MTGFSPLQHEADGLGAGLPPLIVVTGHAREAVEAALAGLPLSFAHNPDFATGLASSLPRKSSSR